MRANVVAKSKPTRGGPNVMGATTGRGLLLTEGGKLLTGGPRGRVQLGPEGGTTPRGPYGSRRCKAQGEVQHSRSHKEAGAGAGGGTTLAEPTRRQALLSAGGRRILAESIKLDKTGTSVQETNATGAGRKEVYSIAGVVY